MAHELSRALGALPQLRALLESGQHRDQLLAALTQAAAGNHLDAIELLIDHGADPNGPWAFGRTPLFYVSRLEGVDVLLRRGAHVLHEASGEDVLSHFLARPRSGGQLPDDAIEYVKRFLDAGLSKRLLEPGRPYLVLACACGVPSILELFLKLGISPNTRAEKRSLFEAMKYAPHRAEIFATLVKAGIDPNTRDERTTLLVEVCREGDVETAKRLIDAGADVNPPLKTTPLAIAEEGRHHVLVDLLLERGARVPGRSFDLETSLALDAAERRAREHPSDGRARHDWARLLMKHGFRAAAAAELFAAEALGVSDPSLRDECVIEAGSRWAFVPFEPRPDDVMGRLDDARVPGARVSDGVRTLPVALVLGPPCTNCDERGETECSLCGGTGAYSSQFSDDDVICSPRQPCVRCGGVKFVIDSQRASPGGCQHAFSLEWQEDGQRLQRCAHCGLAAFHFGGSNGRWVEVMACGVCGRFVCQCASAE